MKYDRDEIKSRASGRWREILGSIAGISDEYLQAKHGPCPKHGGKDKWRVFSNFDETGGCVCNDCGKMGDGFEVIQKITGKTFAESLVAVAEHLGIEPKQKQKQVLQDSFTLIPTTPESEELAFAAWCLTKQPITPGALRAAGAKLARFVWYGQSFPVIAVPVWGPKLRKSPPVGWVMYHAIGGKLPSGKKTEVEWNKVRLSRDCGRGFIGDVSKIETATQILKLEGPPDALAAMSIDLPGDVFAFTTANGSDETPLPWMLELLEGKETIVCHDCDDAGQKGEEKWAKALSHKAVAARRVALPFEHAKTKGKDFRDWLNSGGNWESFLALESTVIECGKAPELRNYNWVETVDPKGREKRVMEPIHLPEIRNNALTMFEKWPKRIGRQLFVVHNKTEYRTLDRRVTGNQGGDLRGYESPRRKIRCSRILPSLRSYSWHLLRLQGYSRRRRDLPRQVP
jgi:hypothetical protein